MPNSITPTSPFHVQSPCTCSPTQTQTKQPVDTQHRSALEQNFVNVAARESSTDIGTTRLFARRVLKLPNLIQKEQFEQIEKCSSYEVATLYAYLEFNRKVDGGFQTPDYIDCRKIMREWKLQPWFDEIGRFVEFDEGSWQEIVDIADKIQLIRCRE